jgi:hypothetical protein
MNPTRREIVSRAGGGLWLLVVGGAFGLWALHAIDTPTARIVQLAVTAVLALLAVLSGVVIGAALQLPPSPVTGPQRLMLRKFRYLTLAEVAGFAVANGVCAATHHIPFIVPANIMVVGLHFIPLGLIFGVRRYQVMGVLFIGVTIATVLWIPQSMQIGSALAWFVMPALGCGATAWVTGMLNLRDAWTLNKRVKGRYLASEAMHAAVRE